MSELALRDAVSQAQSRPTAAELAALRLFSGLPHEGLSLFANKASSLVLAAGDTLYHEGDSGDALYAVRMGGVAALRKHNGRDIELAQMVVGDFFGEMAFIDMQPRSATVRAIEPTALWRWSFATIDELRRTDASQFVLLYMNLSREISRRLRRSDTLLLAAR